MKSTSRTDDFCSQGAPGRRIRSTIIVVERSGLGYASGAVARLVLAPVLQYHPESVLCDCAQYHFVEELTLAIDRPLPSPERRELQLIRNLRVRALHARSKNQPDLQDTNDVQHLLSARTLAGK